MKILLLNITLLLVTFVRAQIEEGFYINKDTGEFLSIYKDRIDFKISNKDAFNTFSIAIGYYEHSKKDAYRVYQSDSILREMSILVLSKRQDSLISIKTLNNDGTPLEYTGFLLRDINSSKQYSDMYTGINGELLFTEKQIEVLSDKKLILEINDVLLPTKKEVCLKKGYDYSVRSLVASGLSYIIFNSGRNLLLKKISDTELKIDLYLKNKVRRFHGGSSILNKDTISRKSYLTKRNGLLGLEAR